MTLFLKFCFAEKYFDMKKNQCKEGLDIYKKFLTRMTRISEFLKVAEVTIVDLERILLSLLPDCCCFFQDLQIVLRLAELRLQVDPQHPRGKLGSRNLCGYQFPYYTKVIVYHGNNGGNKSVSLYQA